MADIALLLEINLWSSTDPFRYPLPKPDANDADSWSKVLEKEKKYDADQCEVWKGEIDSILLFVSIPQW